MLPTMSRRDSMREAWYAWRGTKNTPGGTRTRNPQIRSLMRCPIAPLGLYAQRRQLCSRQSHATLGPWAVWCYRW